MSTSRNMLPQLATRMVIPATLLYNLQCNVARQVEKNVARITRPLRNIFANFKKSVSMV